MTALAALSTLLAVTTGASAEPARLAVVTEPPGAHVFIDDRALGSHGMSPLEVEAEPGPRVVIVQFGDAVRTAQVDAVAGQQVEVFIARDGPPADVAPASAPGPPPLDEDVLAIPFEAPEPPEPGIPWIRGVAVDGAYAHWFFSPLDVKSDEGEKSDWSRVSTEEAYDLTPVSMYRASLTLKTRYADLTAGYQTNRGFSVGEGISTSDVLDLAADFAGLPILKRFSLKAEVIDFYGGRARLKDRRTGEAIDDASFNLKYAFGELRYEAGQLFKKTHGYVFARYASYSIPRNVYVRQSVGEGDAERSIYYQISDELMRVDSDLYQVGAGMRGTPGFGGGHATFLLRMAVGGGPYGLYSLSTGDELADQAYLVGLLVGLEVDVRLPLGRYFHVGLHDTLDLQFLAPIGLPDDVEADAKEAGAPVDDLSFSFGTVDLLNTLYVYAGLDW
ncbi:MAG: hypothetical protein H6702_22685 [Myxococcales bacterium]|nr:hypothetical protein [Myxococcales bacterium]